MRCPECGCKECCGASIDKELQDMKELTKRLILAIEELLPELSSSQYLLVKEEINNVKDAIK